MDFTQQEWDNCIKVLKILSRDPDKGLDINTLKGLVTKIHKQAKKQNKAKVLEDKAETLIGEAPQYLSSEKIKKRINAQDTYRQYDQSLRANTALFKNYQVPLLAQQIDNQAIGQEAIYAKKCYNCKTPKVLSRLWMKLTGWRGFMTRLAGITQAELPLLGHFLKDYKPYFW